MAYPAGGNTSPGCGDCVAVDYGHTIYKLLVKPTYFINNNSNDEQILRMDNGDNTPSPDTVNYLDCDGKIAISGLNPFSL